MARVEERSRFLSPSLVAIARDHAAFVQGLTRQRTLLERRTYVVVPWSAATELGSARNPALRWRLPWRSSGRVAIDDEHAFRLEAISRQLTDRCDAIGRQLSRAGLRTARLDDVGLAQLYHSSWAPEIARSQRLRRELTDYTALVVGASVRPSRSLRAEEIDGVASLERAPAGSRT